MAGQDCSQPLERAGHPLFGGGFGNPHRGCDLTVGLAPMKTHDQHSAICSRKLIHRESSCFRLASRSFCVVIWTFILGAAFPLQHAVHETPGGVACEAGSRWHVPSRSLTNLPTSRGGGSLQLSAKAAEIPPAWRLEHPVDPQHAGVRRRKPDRCSVRRAVEMPPESTERPIARAAQIVGRHGLFN